MIKEIKFPDWVDYMTEQGAEPTHHHYGFQKQFKKWFDKEIKPINEAIRNGVEVYGCSEDLSCWYQRHDKETDTHKAFLIGITETKPETAEDVLRDWIEFYGKWDYSEGEPMGDFLKRAKAALERGEK